MFNAHMFFSKSKKINFSPEDAWRVAMRKLGQNPIVRKNFNFLENIINTDVLYQSIKYEKKIKKFTLLLENSVSNMRN